MVETENKNGKYSPEEIEFKWQKFWEENGFYIASDFAGNKYYILIEFPYPSGAGLHVGHVRSWSAMDAYARKKRMEGYNVLYPMGWDAFGLPAENYAIKNKIHPSTAVEENIANFKRQIKSLGLSFDWSREINTTDPKYYKWTQWIFLQFYKKGLAYRAEVTVNWCPTCKTNLADEEVTAEGVHERCGCPTEKRMQKQWLLKITEYADRLLEDLKKVDYSPRIATQQVNWIGRSQGARVKFQIRFNRIQISNFKYQISNMSSSSDGGRVERSGTSDSSEVEEIEVFTTALDTIFGTTFMVLSPELAKSYLDYVPEDKKKAVLKYIEDSLKKSELERQAEGKVKTGVDTGFQVINPFNKREIPVFVADYVLANYGTGAVMGVPGHDRRDYEFAKKYNLQIIPVIRPVKEDKGEVSEDGFWEYAEIKSNPDKAVLFDSGEFSGLTARDAKKKMEEVLVKRGIGEKTVDYHLRDWVFSRQHYWGEPIPIIYCNRCWEIKDQKSKIKNIEEDCAIINGEEHAIVPVPEEDLPVELPYLESYEPSGTGESPLANVQDWVNVQCPVCGGKAKRETDTMPNWAGSNWYYLAYLFADKLGNPKSEIRNPKSNNIFSENQDVIKYWMPVDLYQGGYEHTTLHLLYSRFVYKFLFDIGAVPTAEPYLKRRSHGIVLGPDGRKMSKSFGNVINPDDIVKKYGADTLRIYEMFMGPFDQTIAWSDEGVEGCYRFLKRVWNLAMTKVIDGKSDLRLVSSLHKTIQKVTSDLESMKFNTAIAVLMEFNNEWKADKKGLGKDEFKKFLLILAPFAPHMTEELYQFFRNPKSEIRNPKQTKDTVYESIHLQKWPEVDEKYLVEEEVTVVVQVNGKRRGEFKVQSSKFKVQSEIEEMAGEVAGKYLVGKEVKRVIYVEGKIVNFVTN
ncbi:MAG: leucine--tRNA ligase [Armatimonadetes bacterium]|nr:MAG: leucine--tRNA ligase [Armatimonadota bacterium]